MSSAKSFSSQGVSAESTRDHERILGADPICGEFQEIGELLGIGGPLKCQVRPTHRP